MEKTNYLVKLSDSLTNPMDKLFVVKAVTQDQIATQLHSQFTAAFTLASILKNGEIPMIEAAIALMAPTDDETDDLKSDSLAAMFYWLKSMGVLSISDDNKTLLVDLSDEKLEEKWNSMESWYLTYQHHLFKGTGRELQVKVMLASLFQGFTGGLNVESEAKQSLKSAMKVTGEGNPTFITATTKLTDVLKEIIAQPGLQPSHGRIEFTLGE